MIYPYVVQVPFTLMLYLLEWMWLVVEVGHLMCFNWWIHWFIGLKEDIHCDLFFEWIQWMIWFQTATLCDLSLSWIHLMVLRFVVKKLEWHLKLKCSLGVQVETKSVCCWIWFGGFLSLSSFYTFYFIIFNLVSLCMLKPQTFGTRLKWG
jgi:hypothetical protein